MTTQPVPPSEPSRQPTVLVIDDEAPIRDNLVRFLRLEGYQVIDAADGAAGLAAALQCMPDLILCDVMMPRLNGFEVLAHLQATPTHRHIPLIFLSASAEPEKTAGRPEHGRPQLRDQTLQPGRLETTDC